MKPNAILLLALGLGVVLLSMRRRKSSGMGAEGDARLARELAQIPTVPPPGPGLVIDDPLGDQIRQMVEVARHVTGGTSNLA